MITRIKIGATSSTNNLSPKMSRRINTCLKSFFLLLFQAGKKEVFSEELKDGNVLIAEINGEVSFRNQDGSLLIQVSLHLEVFFLWDMKLSQGRILGSLPFK